MAGRRRDRGPVPRQAEQRQRRREELLRQRMTAAATPTRRLRAAGDYAAAVVAELGARGEPAAAGALADELARTLVDTARAAQQGVGR